jgi:hypothetical protein
MSVVKGRYGETFTLLAVSGVAANVRFNTRASVQAGFGPSNNYLGNLVPFEGGLAYEENPTITYAPVQGERYIRELLSPIPLDILLILSRSTKSGIRQFIQLVSRVNDMRNPDFLEEPYTEPDPRFSRFVELSDELIKAAVIDLLEDPRKEVAFDIVLNNYAPRYLGEVAEYLNLLGLEMPAGSPEHIVLPVYLAIRTKGVWGIGMTTRSTLDLIDILQAAVDVPKAHANAGMTIKYPPLGLAGQGLRIISSKKRPKNITWAVKYRGYWFYIDDTDQYTKAFFRMLRVFWSVNMAASANTTAAPVLTLPVSR